MISPGKQRSGFPLLWRSALRYARERPWQTGLNILGITIGVMMVVAVDMANNSARRSFDASLDLLSGSITHQIVGGSDGVPDPVFTNLKQIFGLRRAAPTLSGQVRVNGRELTLVGMDVISEAALQRRRPGLPAETAAVTGNFVTIIGSADSVVMPSSLAQDLGLATGDSFVVRSFSGSRDAVLAGVFGSGDSDTPGEIILADITGAQYFLNRPGRLDSIDLVLADREVAQLESWLPPGLALVPAQLRNDNLRQMSEAFHINLLAMSLLSLLVAGLLIYNTVTLSVIQRQKTLGVFRAQGVSRRQVFILVILENAVTGLIASVTGVLAGVWLGKNLVSMVTATVDELYFDLSVTGYFIDPQVIAKGVVLGVGLSLVSAALPALRAMTSRPVTLQHISAQGSEWRKHIPWLTLAGFLLMAVGWGMLLPEYGSLVTGFVALTVMVFGFCLVVPLCLVLILSLALGLGKGILGLPGIMALRNSLSAINRTGLAVAALCVAVSVTVGVGVMVGSFRGTVILWLDQSLPGDLQLTAVGSDIPDGLETLLEDTEGVAGVHQSVLQEVESPFGPVRLGMNDIPAAEKFYMKEVADAGYVRFDRGEGVFVSEPVAYLQQLDIGDSVSLLTNRGMATFPVLGIFYDYTSGTGLVHVPASLYRNYWPEEAVSRLTLDIMPDADINSVQAAIESAVAGTGGEFSLVSNRDLRTLTLQVFDRTFAITNVLRLLAILVAFVGVLSTLMALQLERLREFAILRATGMTPVQVASLVIKQTVVLGICSGLLALPLGLLMSDILIDVINRRSFGWSMQHFLPQSVLVQGFALAVLAAALAGCYPAWRAGRIRPALALREE